MLKVDLTKFNRKTPSDYIGIDKGQSLLKIAYIEDNELVLSFFLTQTCIIVFIWL